MSLGLQISGVILFTLAAIGVPSGRYSLIAAGLACVTLAAII